MKNLIALLMTLVMLTGACAAFAEAEAVDHQAALEAMLEAAGVELQSGDLSRSFQKALSAVVMLSVFTHTGLTEEQLTEWEAVKVKSSKEFMALETEDRTEAITIISKAIDGMESITPFTKSMLKRMAFNSMYQMSEITDTERITQKERDMIYAIYAALEEALHGADEARKEEIVAGVKAGMEELVGLHNVRDDMMFILKFLQEKGEFHEDMDAESLMQAAGEILTAADQVMGDRIEELDAALAEIPAIDEETVGWFVQLSEETEDGLKMLDAEELAEVEIHIRELANAVLQADQDALNEQMKHVWDDHIAKKLDQRNYDVLMGMEDEELRVLGMELLGAAYAWENGSLDGSLMGALNALELNWNDLSEEDIAAIKDIVAKKIESVELPEGTGEKTIERMTNSIIVLNRLSEEEKVLANSFINLLCGKLGTDMLDEMELVELENEMETLLYELGGDTEKYQVLLEKTVSIHEGVDVDEWMTKLANLSDSGKFLLTIRFLEHFEVYNMLPKGSGARMLETDKALFEAIQNLELNGQETTMEQLQALEKAVYDVLSQLDMPVEALACEVAKTVSNSLIMSSLTEEEQETVATALKGFSLKLAEGNPEDIRVLRNYQHKVMHLIEEGKFLPQGGQA